MTDDTVKPSDSDNTTIDSGYISLHPDRQLPAATQPAVTSSSPAQAAAQDSGTDAALTMLRDKLSRIYAEAPDPFASVGQGSGPSDVSKHQRVMQELQTSGHSLADIQTAWHQYYASLPDEEKHAVWREFYESEAGKRVQTIAHGPTQPDPQPTTPMLPNPVVAPRVVVQPALPKVDQRTPQQLRSNIRRTVSANGQLRLHHHLQSLGFGLAIGILTLVITLFSFFNEVIIAPFIQPGRAEGATPIIIDPGALATGKTAEVIIPKINLEIPVDYSQTSDDENAIQNALEHGVVHYPSTVLPGQHGNAAYFGHSSNNIFNPGKYKFAFVLLHELQPGDTFYLTYHGRAYVYRVFRRLVVDPDQVGVLDNVPGHTATATLITCDPPGTALHRLVITGDQISPDPAGDKRGNNTISSNPAVTVLPDNGPSLWDRITGLFSSN